MKKNSLKICISLALLVLACAPLNGRGTVMVIIHYVPFNIATTIDVDCDHFLESFSKKVKSDTITNVAMINHIDSLVSTLQKDTIGINPDVRLKMELYRENGSIDIICTNGYLINYNGIPMTPSDELIEGIKCAIYSCRK